MTEEMIDVYELDFGDTNLIDKDIETILEWIKTEMSDMKVGDEDLEYTISKKQMTKEEYENLPDWA